MKKLLCLASLVALSAASSFAGDSCKSFKEAIVAPEGKFRDVEFQVDGFYAQMFGPGTSGNVVNTGPGGGFGGNVIFAKYFGAGVENLWYSNDGRGDYLLTGKAIARYPIESLSLAPYAVVGGGAGFGRGSYGFGLLGAGLEYRLTRNIGSFVEGKWLFGAPNAAALLTTGVRFIF